MTDDTRARLVQLAQARGLPALALFDRAAFVRQDAGKRGMSLSDSQVEAIVLAEDDAGLTGVPVDLWAHLTRAVDQTDATAMGEISDVLREVGRKR